MEFVLYIVFIWVVVGFLGVTRCFDRAENLLYAVHNYHLHCIVLEEEPVVDYYDIKIPSLIDSLLPWRWTYTHYISKDKFEIIKKYI